MSIGLSSFPERFVPLPYKNYITLIRVTCQRLFYIFSWKS
nr:MAG TPA: hypothetical protein [Caudoviricetes sp.]DAO80328.1 MAG TPA: hypothetical protein [Caudoviricetes sp.]